VTEITYDIAVIGGGVNGCGITRDAAGRGLSVILFEQNDLASGTSSSSTKLIHGGLRYLEHYKFRLVRESLKERDVLLAMAPHISWPLRFVLPHLKGLRPKWLIRLGLHLYDHLGCSKFLPKCRSLDLSTDPAGAVLKDEIKYGFEYSDCWVDDARLVVLTAMDAKIHGANICTRTEVISTKRYKDHWAVVTQNTLTGEQRIINATVLINATGPWVADVLNQCLGSLSQSKVRLVKGSHIVVKRLFEHDRAYIFQNADARITFAIPYENDFTLIGTTDIDYDGDPKNVTASPDEITYLCSAAQTYFSVPVRAEDVVWTYSGVRPLFDNGEISAQKATRDYVLELDTSKDEALLLTVFGGKITTFRRLAEDVLKKLSGHINPPHGPWTRSAKLPGGDFPIDQFETLKIEIINQYPEIDPKLIKRLTRSYGTLAKKVLSGVQNMDHLGVHFGDTLYQTEVEYLQEHEWAIIADDILWRRTKLGLQLSPDEVEKLSNWMENNN
jgi:glycerol-3-phosphate dehydrogenase